MDDFSCRVVPGCPAVAPGGRVPRPLVLPFVVVVVGPAVQPYGRACRRVRRRPDILMGLGVLADALARERAVMSYRAVCLVVLAACGVLAVMLGSLIVIPRLLYPPLSAADLHGVASAQVSTDAQVDDGGVIDGEDAGAGKGPAGGVPAGLWCSWWRPGGQSAVTSAAAVRALDSSTMALRLA